MRFPQLPEWLEHDTAARVVYGGAQKVLALGRSIQSPHLEEGPPAANLEEQVIADRAVAAAGAYVHVGWDETRSLDRSRHITERQFLSQLGCDDDEVRLKVDLDVVNAIQALQGVSDAPPSRASLQALADDAHLLETRVLIESVVRGARSR